MKTADWMVLCLLAGVLALAGCSKEKPAPVMEGVAVDLPKLQETFSAAGADAQNAVSEVRMGIRYGDYARATAALNKLAGTAGLTEAQKKVVNDITEQVKQLASKAAAARSQ